MMRKEADAKKKAAEEIERATLRAEAKARVREAKSSPEILAAKRALEEQRKKDQERRAATRVIRYYVRILRTSISLHPVDSSKVFSLANNADLSMHPVPYTICTNDIGDSECPGAF